jgi:hypothetical protein
VLARLTLVALLGFGAVACATGPRPALGEDAVATGPVGDASVDAVLAKLEQAEGPPLTARYHLVRKLGPLEGDATVVRSGPTSATTLGTTRVLRTAAPVTCDLAANSCTQGIDERRFAELGVSSEFWAASPARALRVSYGRRTGAPTPSSQDVAGRPAECVDIPVEGGAERYCVSPLGAIALWDTGDKRVELTELLDTPDESQLLVPNS